MASLVLPLPKHAPPAVELEAPAPAPQAKAVPPQGKRKGWVPRSIADFGGGGAFPEVHVAQYPLDMGRKGNQGTSQVLALTSDGTGKARHDMVATVGQRDGKHIVSARDSLKAKHLTEEELAKPEGNQAAENSERTRLALAEQMADKVAPPSPQPRSPSFSPSPSPIPNTGRQAPPTSGWHRRRRSMRCARLCLRCKRMCLH